MHVYLILDEVCDSHGMVLVLTLKRWRCSSSMFKFSVSLNVIFVLLDRESYLKNWLINKEKYQQPCPSNQQQGEWNYDHVRLSNREKIEYDNYSRMEEIARF